MKSTQDKGRLEVEEWKSRMGRGGRKFIEIKIFSHNKLTENSHNS